MSFSENRESATGKPGAEILHQSLDTVTVKQACTRREYISIKKLSSERL